MKYIDQNFLWALLCVYLLCYSKCFWYNVSIYSIVINDFIYDILCLPFLDEIKTCFFCRYSKSDFKWIVEFFTQHQLWSYETMKAQDRLTMTSKPDQIYPVWPNKGIKGIRYRFQCLIQWNLWNLITIIIHGVEKLRWKFAWHLNYVQYQAMHS